MSDQTDDSPADLVLAVAAVLGTAVAILLPVGPEGPLLVAFVVLVATLGLALAVTLLVEYRYAPTG